MTYKEWLGVIGATVALMGSAYTVVVKAGYLVPRAEAEEIAQQKANVVQQALIDESRTRTRKDIQLQMDLLVLELSYLGEVEQPTETDLLRKRLKEHQLQLLQEALADLDKEKQ